MTKNRSMKIAVLVLALALLTSCFVGSTFAKYTSSATGTTSTATVAKWSFTDASSGELAKTGNNGVVTFNLFETILDTDTTDDGQDDHVEANRIAPGTKGSAAFDITNNSEVDAAYEITFNVVNANNVPITITANSKTYTWTDGAFKNGEDVLKLSGTVDMGATIADTLDWVWAFDGDAATDTALGIMGQGTAPEVSVTATVVFTQVD